MQHKPSIPAAASARRSSGRTQTVRDHAAAWPQNRPLGAPARERCRRTLAHSLSGRLGAACPTGAGEGDG